VGVHTKFSIAVQIEWHMRNTDTHGVCAHNNGMCGVCSIDRAQRNFVGEHTISRDNLINGARGVLVRGGGILNFGMVQHVE
jgi:hypothetical protein